MIAPYVCIQMNQASKLFEDYGRDFGAFVDVGVTMNATAVIYWYLTHPET